MLALLRRFAADGRASVATEMALVAPLLATLMFGSLELGTYFWTEHKVIKAVRDGARFAARQSYDEYPACSPSSGLIDETRNVTRTGQIANGGTPRIGYWTDETTITVTADCDHPGSYAGIYALSPIGVPVVTVSASVPYESLSGFISTGLELHARSEAPVYGV
jgi:hypothetical protein